MRNNILYEMRKQMQPDDEIVGRLIKSLKDDAVLLDEEDLGQHVHTVIAERELPQNRRKHGRGLNRIVAAAAVIVVLVASGLLVSSLSGNKSFTSGEAGGKVVTSDVMGPAEYSEIYTALRDASGYNPWLFGGRGSAPWGMVMEDAIMVSPDVAPSASQNSNTAKPATDGMGASPDYSSTNVQVAGIDEADIIKTDGAYIYVLRGEWLLIFKASGEKTEEVSRIQIVDNTFDVQSKDNYSYRYDNPIELYIHGPYASILVSRNESMVNSRGYYTYDSSTRIICLNISDPTAPKVVAEFFQSGYYNSSRLQSNVLYVISNYAIYDEIDIDDPSTYVPMIGKNGSGVLVECADIRIMPYVVSANYTVVTSIDIGSLQRIDQKSILGSAETIYMSYSNLYIASTVYTSEDKEPYKESVYTIEEHIDRLSTQIMRIALNDGNMDVAAQCTIDGMLLNQFSLDEYEGNLRLAVTTNSYSYKILRDKDYGIEQIVYGDDWDQTNALYILGPSMDKLGSIEGLAKDERIYSVRFSGPVGYMVTFRQVDPLFAMDLSDPKNPKVTSELKIPGFSTYLHSYGEGRLLGLGFDTNENRTTGMKMSMFDVSDAFDIREADVTLIGIYSSEALYNHKAVLVDVGRNIIGFAGEQYGDNRHYYLYEYVEGEGFKLKARLELSMPESRNYSYFAVRGLYIDSYLYVFSGDSLDVFDLNDLKNVKCLFIQIDSDKYYEQPVPLSIVD